MGNAQKGKDTWKRINGSVITETAMKHQKLAMIVNVLN